MKEYCVNKNEQENGDHEVHEFECSYIPDPENRIDLGEFSSCAEAVQKAKEYYPQANGCVHCANPCHTQ